MQIDIINEPLILGLYGKSGTAIGKDYAGMAFKLSGEMWNSIKTYSLKHKGMNIWVYEPDDRVFASVEFLEKPEFETGLEHRQITIPKYAYYKHIGAYSLIKEKGMAMEAEIKRQGYTTHLPYIEIYGHWNADETKLETELIMSIK